MPPAPKRAAAPRKQRVSNEVFRPIRTRRTFEAVVGQIVDLIQSGQIREGEFLPGERALATAMQVGRPTVRLAIELLADANVVEVQPGRGGGIQLISMWVPAELQEGEKDALGPTEIFEALEARRALEPRVAQLAALRATETDFAEMRDAIELQESTKERDSRQAVQADMLFHRLIWRAARNAALERAMGTIMADLTLAIDMAMRTDSDQATAVDIHRDTLTALMRGSMDEIDEAMDRHMAYLEAICEDVFGRTRVREVPAFLRGSDPRAIDPVDGHQRD